mmetsp:Transcript_13619/g.40814  ORF Transcript_13619/g.40814 Transcript_13619/m.40814 type:complete len:332 (+) Transcript_13619:663-1658(+)
MRSSTRCRGFHLALPLCWRIFATPSKSDMSGRNASSGISGTTGLSASVRGGDGGAAAAGSPRLLPRAGPAPTSSWDEVVDEVETSRVDDTLRWLPSRLLLISARVVGRRTTSIGSRDAATAEISFVLSTVHGLPSTDRSSQKVLMPASSTTDPRGTLVITTWPLHVPKMSPSFPVGVFLSVIVRGGLNMPESVEVVDSRGGLNWWPLPSASKLIGVSGGDPSATAGDGAGVKPRGIPGGGTRKPNLMGLLMATSLLAAAASFTSASLTLVTSHPTSTPAAASAPPGLATVTTTQPPLSPRFIPSFPLPSFTTTTLLTCAGGWRGVVERSDG